jgi:hypothetical protein
MPGLLPMILAGSLIVLAADKVPELNVDKGCQAAATTGVRTSGSNDDSACKRDESDAHTKLTQEWDQFSKPQHDQCVRLSTLGGSPSYVELLTCLELAKQASALPPADTLSTGQGVEKQ